MKSRINYLVKFIAISFILTVNSVYSKNYTTVSYSDSIPLGLNELEWSGIKQKITQSDEVASIQNKQGQATTRIRHESYLKASNTQSGDLFGYATDISGNTLVVGAPQEDGNARGVNGDDSNNSAVDSGAVYVFVKLDGVWQQQAYLKASNTDAGDIFGYDVALEGDTILVSALYEGSNARGINGNQSDNSLHRSGAVYVFVRENDTWSQQAYLKASNTGDDDRFGASVAISGETIVVGAYFESSNATGVNGNQSDNSVLGAGAAYVFTRTSNTWMQSAYLKASNTGGIDDIFGFDVDIHEDTIVVGAYWEDSNAIGVNQNQNNSSAIDSGAAYVFKRSRFGSWSQQAYLKASNTGTEDYFGLSVSVFGDSIAVGALLENGSSNGVNGEDNNTLVNSGAVYVFTESAGVWSQQAYIKASNPDSEDLFGRSVFVTEDKLIVGADGESSNSVGVNGNQSDNSSLFSGAVYVFERNSEMWSQSSYVKAHNTGRNDEFGISLATDGDMFVVGADFEDSESLGVDNDDSNNSAVDSGAAYVFSIGSGFPMQSAHSALWYNPEQSGHGINVYMLADNRIIVIWYIYDDEGNQVWLLGIGTHDGIKATLDVTIYDGAMFPPNFEESDVNAVVWGQFELEFTDCNNGLFKWIPIQGNGFATGELSLIRLNNTLGLTCSDDGIVENRKHIEANKPEVNGEGFGIQAGHTALWYNPEQSGHGLSVYALADNRIIVIWYVYDDEGNQVWLLGIGNHDGVKATLDVNIASGANFPPNFHPEDVNLEEWGQFELEFSDCNAGLFKWMPLNGNGFTAGEMNVVRLNNTQGLSCVE